MTPFYAHLEGIPGFGIHSDIDRVGLWATAGVGAAFAAHGLVQIGKRMFQGPPEGPPADRRAI